MSTVVKSSGVVKKATRKPKEEMASTQGYLKYLPMKLYRDAPDEVKSLVRLMDECVKTDEDFHELDRYMEIMYRNRLGGINYQEQEEEGDKKEKEEEEEVKSSVVVQSKPNPAFATKVQLLARLKKCGIKLKGRGIVTFSRRFINAKCSYDCPDKTFDSANFLDNYMVNYDLMDGDEPVNVVIDGKVFKQSFEHTLMSLEGKGPYMMGYNYDFVARGRRSEMDDAYGAHVFMSLGKCMELCNSEVSSES